MAFAPLPAVPPLGRRYGCGYCRCGRVATGCGASEAGAGSVAGRRRRRPLATRCAAATAAGARSPRAAGDDKRQSNTIHSASVSSALSEATRDILRVSARQVARRVRSGALSAERVARAYLHAAAATEPAVRGYLLLDADAALARARAVDAARARGERLGRLAGVPLAVKDNLSTRGVRTTAGSRVLSDFVPAYDATAVERMLGEHAVLLGKTNLDEFGMGSSTETSAFGATTNPHDERRVPGGSSGGSAAVVAAGSALVALGSDTGGSVRQPASYCGVVGVKPSYGRVSRHGLLAYASSLDTVGPIARDVRDVALCLDVIAGRDARDGTTIEYRAGQQRQHADEGADDASDSAGASGADDELDGPPPSLAGLRVGVLAEAMGEQVDSDVRAAMRAAADTLRSLGADVVDVSLPRLSPSCASYYVIASSEASANLARYDGVRYGTRDASAGNTRDMYLRTRSRGFGEEVKRRIMLGTYALSSGYYNAYYRKAQQVRALVAHDFAALFGDGDDRERGARREHCDLLISPVAPTSAFRIGEKSGVGMYRDDVMTIPASLAGLPALSVPCAAASERSAGLPIGLQLIGRYADDAGVLRAGHAFEIARPATA